MSKPVPGRVRCLSPRTQEHYFNSPDRCRVRICERCRRWYDRNAPPPVFRDPSPDPRRPR